jgi:membrane protein
LRRTLISIAFTVGITVFGLIATAVLGIGPALKAIAGPTAALVAEAICWPVLVACMAVVLALLYRYGPSRDPVKIRWISWGSAVVILAWLLTSAAFSVYVANFSHYNKTYGALGAAIGFMTWIYLSSMLVLAGAELNAEMEHQTAKDTTVGAAKPLGHRSAKMADSVGAAQGSSG